jgi:hypothetical protein
MRPRGSKRYETQMNIQHRIACRAATCGLIVAGLVGCGRQGPQRAVVSGAVTYQGHAIADGLITFVPSDGTTGPSMVAAITAGRYRLETWGGIPVGKYRVEIIAAADPSRQAPNVRTSSAKSEMPGADCRQCIPDKYNAKTQLRVTIGPDLPAITHDFTLAE